MTIKDEELAQISASAFLNMVLHIFRFWSTKDFSKREIVYGFLMGYIMENVRVIRNIIPILHTNHDNFDFDKNFIEIWKSLDAQEEERGSMNRVIGWYRSSNKGIKFTARDTKNQILFQEKNPKYIALIFAPDIYLQPDQYGFSVFRLQGDKYYNMMTDNYKIPWEIQTIEDPQEIISDFKVYINNYFLNKPLILEYNEQNQ
ncbi:MAG: hypothetical protein ACP6IY_05375 [Promethearchaeia archaeon]